MSENLDQAAAEFLRELTRTLADAKAATIAEAPDVLRQIVGMHVDECVWAACILVVCAAICLGIAVFCLRMIAAERKRGHNTESFVALAVVAFVLGLLGLGCALDKAYSAHLAEKYPKAYLVERFTSGGKR